MTFIQIPTITSWRDPVANVAALPPVGNIMGDAIITQDTMSGAGTSCVVSVTPWPSPSPSP